jgi:hypothetical protein
VSKSVDGATKSQVAMGAHQHQGRDAFEAESRLGVSVVIG